MIKSLKDTDIKGSVSLGTLWVAEVRLDMSVGREDY